MESNGQNNFFSFPTFDICGLINLYTIFFYTLKKAGIPL